MYKHVQQTVHTTPSVIHQELKHISSKSRQARIPSHKMMSTGHSEQTNHQKLGVCKTSGLRFWSESDVSNGPVESVNEDTSNVE